MNERAELAREKLTAQYRLIFTKYPELRILAQEYWNQTQTLEPGPDAVEKEGKILTDTVSKMVDILSSSPTFTEAIKRANGNPIENAIRESLMMIDIIQDL